MPHGFEYVVRPFQSPGSLGNVVIAGTPARTEEKAHITWGGVGTMPAVKTLYPDTVVNLCNENLNELGRDNDSIRIVGNDGESYVDVDRPNRVRLDKKEQSNDGTLGATSYSTTKLDSRLPQDHFSTSSDAEWKSNWKSGWGACAVTWNLKNP